MIFREFFAPCGLHYMRVTEPFSLESLGDALEARRDEHAHTAGAARLAFYDYSQIDLMQLDGPGFRAYIERRRVMNDPLVHLPTAALVNSLGSVGMLRMYSILADFSKLHTEESLFPTLDLGEAVAWMARQDDEADAGELRALIDGASQKSSAE